MTRLVLQLAVIVIAARLLGFAFDRYLKQPRVLGELIAGMIMGPYALGGLTIPFFGGAFFPAVEGTVPVSSELYGVATIAAIVLLFRAGLETDVSSFLRYSVVGSTVGFAGVVLSFALGDALAVLWGIADSFLAPQALFLGTVSTATSVGITARILSEKRKMASPEGVTILAGAVVDDVLGIIILATVVGISKAGQSGSDVPWGRAGLIAAKAFGFWFVCTALGILLAKRITRVLKLVRSNEVIAATAFGLALFLAGLSEMAGLAMIIGAYVTGLSLSQTDVVHEIHERLEGIHQFFVPVFFCVMGMMVDFAALAPVALFGLVYTAVAVVAKLVGCGLPAWLMGFNLRGAFRIGAGMLPRGEVTLIVAGIGLSSGIVGPELFGVAVMALLIASIVAPPILGRSLEGGSGLRVAPTVREGRESQSVEMEFPSAGVARFMRLRIEQAFRDEEFFVHRLHVDEPVCQVRKDDIVITLVQKGTKIIITTARDNEHLVRFIILEEIVELQDLLESARQMKSAESISTDIAGKLFADEEEES